LDHDQLFVCHVGAGVALLTSLVDPNPITAQQVIVRGGGVAARRYSRRRRVDAQIVCANTHKQGHAYVRQRTQDAHVYVRKRTDCYAYEGDTRDTRRRSKAYTC